MIWKLNFFTLKVDVWHSYSLLWMSRLCTILDIFVICHLWRDNCEDSCIYLSLVWINVNLEIHFVHLSSQEYKWLVNFRLSWPWLNGLTRLGLDLSRPGNATFRSPLRPWPKELCQNYSSKRLITMVIFFYAKHDKLDMYRTWWRVEVFILILCSGCWISQQEHPVA